MSATTQGDAHGLESSSRFCRLPYRLGATVHSGPTPDSCSRPARRGLDSGLAGFAGPALWLALLLPALPGCCLFVRHPEARELLAVGFRTPEQAFRSFQLGWRADEPDLEHRCLSRGFKERERISRLAYREFRARLVRDEPFLRLGIADAEAEGPAEVAGDRARLVLASHGRRIEVHFVRDDYVEVWRGDERVLDDHRPFAEHIQVESRPDDKARLWARVELDSTVDAAAIDEVRLGRDWKIDDLRLLDPR